MFPEIATRPAIFSEMFLHVFSLAAEQAGLMALRLQDEVRLQHKPGSGSPESAALTAVDLAVQDVVLRLLLHRLGGAALDAEEDTELASRFPAPGPGRPIIVLDPVDGTLNFAESSRDYAIMGAMLLEGFYLASMVHFPAWGKTYWAQRGGGAWMQEGRGAARPVTIDAPPPTVLIPPKSYQRAAGNIQGSGFAPALSRCSAVDATAPATGRGCGSISLAPLDRRRAIGFLITAEAGGSVIVGGRPWDGREPQSLPGPASPAVAAGSVQTADRLRSLLEAAA